MVGFAYTSAFRPKTAYNRSAEVTVYTNQQLAPKGAGTKLYEALLASAEPHFHRLYAVIALPNPGSLGLHAKLGFKEAQIPASALSDRTIYIQTVREGLPGYTVKAGTKLIGRSLFIRLFDTNSANLSRFYNKKHLNRHDSEEVLDTFRVTAEAIRIWEDKDAALEWLNMPIPALAGDKPIDLFDTFDGRRWVSEVLRKIEFGEFS